MVTAAAKHGYDLTGHLGIQVSPVLMEWADLILAMDSTNLTALRGLAETHTAPKLALYLGDQDVGDPWGKPDDAFAACVEIIHAGARRHIRWAAAQPAVTDSRTSTSRSAASGRP